MLSGVPPQIYLTCVFLSAWRKHECKSMVMSIFGLWCEHEGIYSCSQCAAGLLSGRLPPGDQFKTKGGIYVNPIRSCEKTFFFWCSLNLELFDYFCYRKKTCQLPTWSTFNFSWAFSLASNMIGTGLIGDYHWFWTINVWEMASLFDGCWR